MLVVVVVVELLVTVVVVVVHPFQVVVVPPVLDVPQVHRGHHLSLCSLGFYWDTFFAFQ